MEITKVLVKSFRNIKDLEFAAKDINIISGNNMKGKTNVLNAISFCITGVDLNGSNSLISFVPYGETSASIKIWFNDWNLERSVLKVDNSYEQHIYINGEEKPLKQAEIDILERFGLLSLAKKDTKAFKLLRFLVNPLYYKSVAPKDLRSYIVKAVFGDIDERKIVENLETSESNKNLIISGIETHGSFESYSSSLDKTIKAIKVCKEKYESAKEVLDEYDYHSLDNELTETINNYNNDILNIKTKQAVNDLFVQKLNEQYQTGSVDKNLGIVFYEKGLGEDVWKEVCYPHLFNENINAKFGSTAETIWISIGFVEIIKSYLGLADLPMLVDEGETLDAVSMNALKKITKSQLFITKVEYNIKPGIEVC